jgi:hypothetical protein
MDFMRKECVTSLLIATIAAAACARDQSRQATDTASILPAPPALGATSAPSAPSATAPAQGDIVIDSVTGTNPLVIHGRARTFENAISARVLDGDGKVIQEVHGMSHGGEMGQHNPFDLAVWLLRDPGAHLTVQALDYSARDGSEIGLTSRHLEIPPVRVDATVWFTSTDCTTKSFTRRVPPATAHARLVAEMLIAGPTDDEKRSGAYQSFPQGSQLNRIGLNAGVLTADFNDALQHVGGACTSRALREAITKTLTLPGVKEVVISAGGSRDLALLP